MKQFLTFVFFTFAYCSSHARIMTLAECVSTAIDNNLSLRSARTGIEKGRTGVSQNRSRLLPVIQGVAQFTDYLQSPVNVTTGTLLDNDFPDAPTWQRIKSMKYQSQAGILLNVPVYNAVIFSGIDVAKTMEGIARLSYEKAMEELTVQTSKVYYLAQSSKEQLRLADLNIVRMKELCEITEALYSQGVVMEVDLNRVRINLKTLQANRAALFALYGQQLNMLRYLLDFPIDTALDVTPMETSLPAIHADAMSAHEHSGMYDAPSAQLPELRLAEARQTLTEQRLKAVRTEYLPTLSFTGYAGGLGYNEKLHQFTDHWFGNIYIGFSLRIPVFDANSKKLRMRQLRYDSQQAQNNLDMLRKQTDRSYSDAVLQLSRNIETAKMQDDCRHQAEEVYQIAEVQYKEGVCSMSALLQDDIQLRSAQSSYIQSVCQCRLAQLDILRLSGRLDELR